MAENSKVVNLDSTWGYCQCGRKTPSQCPDHGEFVCSACNCRRCLTIEAIAVALVICAVAIVWGASRFHWWGLLP